MAPYIESATLCDQGHIEYTQPEKDSQGQLIVDMRSEMAKLITGEAIPPRHCAVWRTYSSIEVKKVVIEQDTDLLTDEDMRKYRSGVVAAVYEDLKIWIDQNFFKRRPRRDATNILDVTGVMKCKKVKSKDLKTMIKIIRERLTQRGVKE